MSAIYVTFVDDPIRVDPASVLTFGRDADLCIDDNPYMHRQLGRFSHHGGVWWISNQGSSIRLDVDDRDSQSHLSVTPGATAALPFVRASVRFSVAGASYELLVDAESIPGPAVDDDLDGTGTDTVSSAAVPLNDEQRLLLVALAERRLRDPRDAIDLPANKEVAARLGWSSTKLNRKLDHLCIKFDRLGVTGLRGDSASLAAQRRLRLVDHVVQVGLITSADLKSLEGHA